MAKQTIFLIDKQRKNYAKELIDQAPEDYVCEIKPRVKTRDQEEKYHAMLGDIARQCKQFNQHFSLDDWKRLCVDMFRRDCIENDIDKLAEYWRKNEFKVVPSLDGKGTVILGMQTRVFPKYVAMAFIEWLYAFGADRDVKWKDNY